MIGVDKIDDIGRLGRSGASVSPVARDTEVPGPTMRKYLRQERFPVPKAAGAPCSLTAGSRGSGAPATGRGTPPCQARLRLRQVHPEGNRQVCAGA